MMPEDEPKADAGNEYDAIVSQMKEQGAQRAPLRQSFSAGQEIGQQDAIRALELSKQTGIAPSTILRNLDYVGKRAANPSDQEYDDLVRTAPQLSGWLRDPLNAAAVSGDVGNLKSIEKLMSTIHLASLKRQPDDKLLEDAKATGAERGARLFAIQEENAKLDPNATPFAAEDVASMKAVPSKSLEEFTREETDREYSRLKSMEDYVSSQGPVGPVEFAAQKFGVEHQLPGVPFGASMAKFGNGVNIIAAANRYDARNPTEEDVRALTEFARLQLAEEHRGTTLPTKIAETLLGVTEFGGEVLATGGFSAIGKKLVLGGVEEASVGLLKRVLAKVAGTLVQLPAAGLTAIPADVARRMAPKGELTVGDNGDLQYSQKAGDSVALAIPKAVAARFADQFSAELFGLFQKKVPSATFDMFKQRVAKEGAVEALKFIGMGEVSQLIKESLGAEPWRAPTVVRAMMGDRSAMEELFATTAVGFGMGASGAVKHNRLVDRSRVAADLQNTINYSDMLAKAGQSVAETDVFKKSPEVAKDAIAAQTKDTPHEFQNINAAVFEQKLMQAGLDPVKAAEDLTGKPDALKEALDLGPGGELKVPTAAVITKIMADPKMAALFQGEFRNDPMLPSVNEAQQRLAKIDAEMEAERKAASEKPAEKATGAGDVKDFASIIGKDVAAQAEAAGRSKPEASAIGKIYEAVLRTLGIRGKSTPEELAAKYGPIIQKAETFHGGSQLEQPAFHGSPHRFEKFDSSKIGTGEGAQVYGHGLYFAGNKNVAKYYKETLSGRLLYDGKPAGDNEILSLLIDDLAHDSSGKPSVRALRDEITSAREEYEHRISRILALKERDQIDEINLKDAQDGLAKLNEIDPSKITSSGRGRLYEVDIPDDSDFLDLHKTLTEQSEKVRTAIAAIERDHPELAREFARFHADPRGNKLRTQLEDAIGPKGASDLLLSYGISGNKYFDAASRKNGDGTSNYVVFDDKLVEVKSYEQPGTAGPRGSYVPRDITGDKALIRVLQNPDPSTVPHELGHLFLDMLHDEAKVDPESGIAKDFQKFLDWQGIKDAETWSKMTLDEKRPHHEAWAEAYTRWLHEGKAPSAGLRGVFFRFREWLNEALGRLTKAGVQIPDEIRGVFERLHATDTEIADANERAGRIGPFMEEIQTVGMSAKDAEELASLRADAHRAAVERLDAEALDGLNKQRSMEGKAIRGQIEREVTAVVDGRKDIQARAYLERGTKPDGEALPIESGPPLKLDREKAKEEYGTKALKDIPESAFAEGGATADFIAEELGFTSGDELLKAVAKAPERDVLIKQITDQRMEEKFGPSESLTEEARKAIHNDQQQKLNLYELQWVLKNKPNRFVDLLKRIQSGRYLDEVRTYAENKVGEKSFRENDPRVYERAEKESVKAATEALQKGDWDAFIALKERVTLNSELYRAAEAAREEASKVRKQMKGTQSNEYRSEMFRAGRDYLAQIDDFNDRFSFREVGVEKVEKLKSLRDFVESLADNGDIVQIPDKLLNEAYKTNWKDAPLKDLRDIGRTVTQLEHQAKLKNELRDKQEGRTFEQERDANIKALEAGAPEIKKKPLNSFSKAAERVRNWISAHLSVRNASSIFREMDGFKDGGQLQQSFMRRANEAGADLAIRNEKSTKALNDLFNIFTKRERLNLSLEKVYIPEIKESLSREEIVTIVASLGQEGAAQRFRDGRGWGPAELGAIVSKLTKKEFAFIDAVHKYLATYGPEVRAQIERRTGLPAEMVKAEPVETPHGTLEGGYFPFKYDTRQSPRADMNLEKEEAMRSVRAASIQAQTKHGYTKDRVEGVKLPLRLDLGTLFEHISEVNNDLAWSETLRDLNRLLRDPKMQQAVYDRYGDQYHRQLKEWLNDIATGDKPAVNMFERGANWIRRGTTLSTLGLNAMQGVTDLTGLTQGMARVGPTWVLRGLGRWFGSPERMSETVDWIHEQSPMMRLRSKTLTKELSEARSEIEEKGTIRMLMDLGIDKATGGKLSASDVSNLYYALMTKVQTWQEVPVWLGAYEKAKASHDVKTETSAADSVEAQKKWVSIADQAVLDAYGGGQMKDLAPMQRGNAFKKLLLGTFASFTNRTLNLTLERAIQTKRNLTAENIAKSVGDVMLLYALPAVIGTLAVRALTGKDDQLTAGELVKGVGRSVVSGVPLLREATNAVEGRDYTGPAGLRFAAIASEAAKKIEAGHIPWKEINQEAGIFFHYPALQVQRTIDGIIALDEGRTKNPLAVLFGYRGKRGR